MWGILPVAAQEPAIPKVTYPRLPKQAEAAEKFVPQGWVLETQASGDLNRDGIDDLAFVMQQNDPKNVLTDTESSTNSFDTNPRILAIAFGSNSSRRYALKIENHTLIPRRDNSSQEDPFGEDGGISIKRGRLDVTLHLFMSAGG
jgi:lipoprotein-anchoring transpeptidase ErfK/SrfK